MARYSNAHIRRLLLESDTAATADEKGEKLEQLVVYLFSKIKGVSVAGKNILDVPRAHELDIAFWNSYGISPLSFLDPVTIVECKNTGDPVGSLHVGWFVRKLQDRGAHAAVLVSLSGITGAADGESNAHSEVISALIRDKIKVLLILRHEIEVLCNTDELVGTLKEKFLRLVLRKTVS